MKHPAWYFSHFDKIFGRSTEYDNEIKILSNELKFTGKIISEIGCGTGNHAASLLKYNPDNISLIDIDNKACNICRKRFYKDDRVQVECADGFSLIKSGIDIVICMYSIIQQVTDIDKLNSRLKHIKHIIGRHGKAVIEYIDVDVSKKVYPEGEKSVIVKNDLDHVDISSYYTDTHCIIEFSGLLDGTRISYNTYLLNLSAVEFNRIVTFSGLTVIKQLTLDNIGRRKLAILMEIA